MIRIMAGNYLWLLGVKQDRDMATKLHILFIMLIFPIPAHGAEFEIIKKHDVTVKYEQRLSGAANDIARLIPSLKDDIKNKIGMSFNFPFEIVIYRDREAFKDLVRNNLIAAFAIPDKDLIVLDYSQIRFHSLTLKLIIMHEMGHLILHKNISGDNLPKWFDEGVSQWVSGGINEIINPQSTDVLKRAFIGNKLLSFSDISYVFPSDAGNFILSYEQGRSMVEYIERKYGNDSIKNIILKLSGGGGFYETIRDELALDFTEIEKRWNRDMRIQYTWLGYFSNRIYLIIFVVASFLTIYGFIRLSIKRRDYRDEET